MTEPTTQDLVVSRVLNAPIAAVWRQWTDAELVRTWWGPATYTSPFCQLDLRIGGRFLFCQRTPDGKEIYSAGTYLDIATEERLEFTGSFADAAGNILSPALFGMPGMPDVVRTVVTFDSLGPAKTRLTVTQFEQPIDENLRHTEDGWNQMFDKLNGSVTLATGLIADTERQTAGGKVLWHFTMSLDGFVAGPGHNMDWMTGFSSRPGLVEEYVETTGAVLGGRNGHDAFPDVSATYGGDWDGPTFVLTHHPEDAQRADGVTFLTCDVAEAVRIGLEAADGKNLEVLSADIGRQLLELGLIDEIDLHIAPVLLGDGVRLFDNPGGTPVRVELLNGAGPTIAVNVRYHPTGTRVAS